VAIVGGGDTAAEESTYLSKLCRKVYMIVRRGEMRASKAMQHRVQNTPNIELLWHSDVTDVLGKDSVDGVMVKNSKTGEERKLDISGFFVAIGHKPNTDIFRGQLQMDDLGYIQVMAGSSKTSVEGVFAVGDCADRVYRQAVTAAGTGCMGALDAERYLAAAGMH
jgi:thioredoxin reductase (NADPH)